MAMLKYGHAAVTTAMVDPGKWVDKVVPAGRIKVAKNVIATYDPSQWLLSHVTIIASVDTDRADPEDPKSNYLIKPEYSVFVNNNGDSWERDMLRACYKSFLGANNYCFTAGTRVLMSDGTYKPIDEIQVGDKVINRLGKPAAVLRTFVHEANDLVEIKSRAIMSRSLFVTANHPFWVYSARKTCPKTGRPNRFDKDKDFCRLDKWLGFSVGVHKAAGESFPCGISGSWKDAGCIDPDRDFLTHPVSDLEVPNEEVNENRATLIGWFLAEGFYMRTNNSSDEESGVCFALGNDEYDVAVMLKDLLEKEFGEGFRTGCSPRVRETHSGSYTLCVSNKVVADFFKKWCGEYAWAKKLPEEAMWLPKGLQTRILRSCISGDGCGVLKSRGYIMELKSRQLVQQFMWISWRLGLLPTYKETGVLGRYAECNVVDGYDVYTDPETGKKSRPGYMIRYSCRDSKALDAAAGDSSSLMFGKRDNRFTYKFSNDDGSWLLSKIEGVGPVEGSFTVHNIEVEGDNSYIAEGVAVHNCEHVQIPELAKGKVIDVALREVPFVKDKDGKDLTTLYVDILIATNRKHEDLINKITSGEYNATSMGCLIKYSQCSQCGQIAEDESKACKHVRFFKRNFFYDPNGVRRIVAELCGRVEDPESCRFIDASWVRKPAFGGAVLRNLVEPDFDLSEKFTKAFAVPEFVKTDGMYVKAAAEQAANEIVTEIEAQDPAPAPAPEAPPADAPPAPTDDTRFPEAPADAEKPLGEDAPPPAEGAAPGGDAAGLGGAAPGGAPDQPPQPQVEEPPQDATAKEVKDMLKRTVLNEIRHDLMEGGAQSATRPDQRPAESDLASNDDLVKEASFPRMLREASGEIGERLANAMLIMSNLRDWGRMARYGYSRDDVLGILWYVDGKLSREPVGPDAVRALSKVRLASDGDARRFFTEIIVETGRRPSKSESRKLLKWAGILNKVRNPSTGG